jgi:uncharacterized membrane protein YqjE
VALLDFAVDGCASGCDNRAGGRRRRNVDAVMSYQTCRILRNVFVAGFILSLMLVVAYRETDAGPWVRYVPVIFLLLLCAAALAEWRTKKSV